MKITDMTKQDFAAVPELDLYNDWRKLDSNGHLNFDSIIVIPVENEDGTVSLHDSGWGCMEFCLVDISNEPIGRIGGGTDVIDLDGIGGYGDDWFSKFGHVPDTIPIHGWRIDLLPCGYLRIWARNGLFLNSRFCSTMELFAEDDKRIQNPEYCMGQMIDDTLELLKEQEAVAPYMDYDGHDDVWRCGKCGATIFHIYHNESDEDWKNYAKFCRLCGRKVKWE